jgi:PD-(D/E)XK endonuclease
MDRPSVHTRENQRLINRRRQGDLGEASAIEWFSRLGATIFIPFGHSPDVDLVVQLEGRLLGIQVKTSTYYRDGRWCVQIGTCGGNQSWNRVVKRLDPKRYDVLFVLVEDGRRWCIPSHAVEGKTRMLLGGPKYSEFEVEPGRPIAITPLESSGPHRGSAGVGEPGRTVNSVAEFLSGFESLLPHQSASPSGPSARTRVSANHQITIPLGPFRGSELEVGQPIRVTAAGNGHLLLDRIGMPLDHP